MPEVIKDYRDSTFKLIFDEPELFVQFLNGFSPIEELKGLSSDAVEDMTDRFTTMHQEEREADTVKRIRIPRDGGEMFVISIVEHESHVNHRMPFKLLQYISFVWTEYEKEQQRKNPGAIYRKDFKYPPILPVVLYDGRAAWTADMNMQDKVEMGDVFSPYIPKFEYSIIKLHEYGIGELIHQRSAFALALVLDRLQNSADFATVMEMLPEGYMEQLKRETPERVLHVLADIVRVYMYKAGLAKETVERTARMVAEGGLENMFSVFAENFAEEKRIERQEGRQEGAKEQSIKIAKKMFRRGRSAREVQEMTELPNDTVLELKREYEKNRDVPER